MRKKLYGAVLSVFFFSTLVLTGCGADPAGENPISVISREDGSGTRGAFVSLFEIEEINEEQEPEDETTTEAVITNSTAVMMQMVEGDPNAIGYLSLGSLHPMVKAVSINGVSPSIETLENGTYPVSRPFLLVEDPSGISEVAEDFLNFLTSREGQEVLMENGYGTISGTKEAYRETSQSGKIVLAGSSSVAPVMEKVKEAYCKMHPNVIIEIQQSDSTTGIQSALDGTCDFGMTSRHLKESEKAKGAEEQTIGMDGIAVVVNQDNPVDDLSKEEVKQIFTGRRTDWNQITESKKVEP